MRFALTRKHLLEFQKIARALRIAVGPGGFCSPRHNPHLDPSFLSQTAPYDVAIRISFACHVIIHISDPYFLSSAAPCHVAIGIDFARHVIIHILDRCFLSSTAPYDVAIDFARHVIIHI
jgi:hypothetical protein